MLKSSHPSLFDSISLFQTFIKSTLYDDHSERNTATTAFHRMQPFSSPRTIYVFAPFLCVFENEPSHICRNVLHIFKTTSNKFHNSVWHIWHLSKLWVLHWKFERCFSFLWVWTKQNTLFPQCVTVPLTFELGQWKWSWFSLSVTLSLTHNLFSLKFPLTPHLGF